MNTSNPVSFLRYPELVKMVSMFLGRPVQAVETFTDSNFLHSIASVTFTDGEVSRVGSQKSVEFISWVKENWGEEDGSDWYWRLRGEEVPILRLNREILIKNGGLE